MICEKKEETKKCSYKQEFPEYQCNRETLLGDENCIFHSKDIEGKKHKFNDAFWKEFERQKKHENEYDFRGFVFPGDISFEEKEFEKRVIFRRAQFSGGANFGKAQFSEEALFWHAQFSGEASFFEAQFSEGAYFGGAQFSGMADFEIAQFSGMADFGDAQFSGGAHFLGALFSVGAHFGDAQFSGWAVFNGAEFKVNTNFENIKIEKYNSFMMLYTYLYDVPGLFESIESNKKKFKYSNKTEFLPDNFNLILGEGATARYPIICRKIRDDIYLINFKEKHPKMHFIWWLFADCGRSFFRWALWSLGFAIAFAFIYYFSYTDYMLNFQTVYVSEDFPLFSFIYYSVVTFTTLGFGDIVPRTGWLQFWVMLEVILGYIMLGGLISILANKLARRS